jgi:Ser/Thr protein kinase RdoA (MazF antagonist)
VGPTPPLDVAGLYPDPGRQLALIHTIPVEGFGWIRRDRPDATRLQATLPTLQAFALDELSVHLATLNGVLTAAELRAVDRIVANGTTLLSAKNATLVHGDFDTTHIFHNRGVYSGIIDFGEIRGADPFYDLGHFALHDGERIPARVLPFLLAGYSEVTPLPSDTMQRVRLWSLLIGIRALARSVTRPQSAYQDYLTKAIRKVLAEIGP